LTTEAVSTETPTPIRALEKKALSASVWSILEYGSGMGLRVVSSLVLTRLLLPAYFGEITLVNTLIIGINLLSDIGLAPSVIQSPRGDDPVFLNSAWTLQVLRGVVLWLVALLISYPMSLLYHDPKLAVLLPVLALSTLISSFNGTNLLSLSRHMGVRRLFAIDGSTSLVGLIVTIAWAYVHPSVWAIIAGQIVGTVYRLILSHTLAVAPGIHNRFGWDKECVHSIVHFGRWIFVATAFYFFASQADKLILGRLISLAMLGTYGLAYQLSDVPRAIILAMANRVAYPFIAKIIQLPFDEFRAKFLQYRSYALMAGGFLLSLMVTWGDLLIKHLYDHRYHDAAWMIPIMALGLWQTLLYQTTYPALMSLGKSKYNAYGNAGYCFSIIAAIPLAFHFFGLHGAVIAVSFGDFALYVATQYGATREGVRPLKQDFVMTAAFVAIVLIFHYLRKW
jgi:O-antigen/teichoic acid export membrane protein